MSSNLERTLTIAEGFNDLRMTRTGPLIYNRHDIYIGRSIEKYGEYNFWEGNMFRQVIRRGITAVEVGANMGVHTVLLSQLVGAQGTVHAYEPQRVMFQTMCGNLAINQCSNVFARQAAVADKPGTIMVPHLPPDQRANFGSVSLRDVNQGDTVPVVTLDQEKLPACHFIKIDVEGMEPEVLLGAEQTIRRFKPFMYVENDRRERSREVISILQSFGYRAWWFKSPLYSERNFAGETENIFPYRLSINLLCFHKDDRRRVDSDAPEVSGPDDWWKPDLAEATTVAEPAA